VVRGEGSPSDTVAFTPDPAHATRDLLVAAYYAQRAFREARGRFATSPEELGLAGRGVPGLIGTLRIEATTSLFEAAAEVVLPSGETQTWRIRQDSRIWRDGAEDAVHRPSAG
jgi:hypothetical protein